MVLEAYLAKTWRPDREYIDGRVCERNLGEFDHADLQSAVGAWLRLRQRSWDVRVVVEQRVQVSATRVRVADVLVLPADRPVEQIITRPALICIEILANDDTLVSMRERVADYSAMGVPNIWLFEPESREVWICTAESMVKATGDVLSASGSEIVIPLAEIWADLD